MTIYSRGERRPPCPRDSIRTGGAVESSARIRRPGALESRGMRRRDAGPRWEEDAEEEPRRGRRPTWRRAGGGPCEERREKPAEGEEPGVPKCRPLPASFRGRSSRTTDNLRKWITEA
nr:uncharacterized protein LOC129385005 [Dermacentor andersoni]